MAVVTVGKEEKNGVNQDTVLGKSFHSFHNNLTYMLLPEGDTAAVSIIVAVVSATVPGSALIPGSTARNRTKALLS